MSGQYIVSIASTYTKKIAAAASFYGVKILTNKKNSPHLEANKIEANLYLAFAEKDTWVSDEALKNIQVHFENNTKNFRMEIFEGTEHGFAFPDRHTYNKNAAEKHWSRIHTLFERSLKNN
jgi:carboxymethylenebutenolidase